MDYDDLIQQKQIGEIDDLQFLLGHEYLASVYLKEMKADGITPDNENAREWLKKYENEHLYK